MNPLLARRLALLDQPSHHQLLRTSLHGIERETLRVDLAGQLAHSPHPAQLGAALTHPQITTDYSEALLEFITGTHHDPKDTLAELSQLHRFVHSELHQELLWSASMPCPLPAEEQIPIAQYGNSSIGQLKHIYRLGLALRYGRTMQCIAGIHYNFSLNQALWPLLAAEQGDTQQAQAFQSASYIALIRNFRRYSWLLMYLFGASPALDSGFMRGQPHKLKRLSPSTLYLPYATSLRMSDLGYQSNAQASLTPCYNDLDSYLFSLRHAVSTPYPEYLALGEKDPQGRWQQLNCNVLQIENEYYSSIRPKRVAASGERPLQALGRRGVQYVEVRCLDINPALPLGISLEQCRFLDTFLLYCALNESPLLEQGECPACTANFLATATEGRRPGLQLTRNGAAVALDQWAFELLDGLAPVAELLDRAQGTTEHQQALKAQRAKVADPQLTPSAQQLAELQSHGEDFSHYALRHSQLHAQALRKQPLPPTQQQALQDSAHASHKVQQALEMQPGKDLDAFVAEYLAALQ